MAILMPTTWRQRVLSWLTRCWRIPVCAPIMLEHICIHVLVSTYLMDSCDHNVKPIRTRPAYTTSETHLCWYFTRLFALTWCKCSCNCCPQLADRPRKATVPLTKKECTARICGAKLWSYTYVYNSIAVNVTENADVYVTPRVHQATPHTPDTLTKEPNRICTSLKRARVRLLVARVCAWRARSRAFSRKRRSQFPACIAEHTVWHLHGCVQIAPRMRTHKHALVTQFNCVTSAEWEWEKETLKTDGMKRDAPSFTFSIHIFVQRLLLPAGTIWNTHGSNCLPMALRPQHASAP